MNEPLSNDGTRPEDERARLRELERLHPASHGWALCCCRHDRAEAGDVLHSAYLKVLDGRARYDGRAPFKTWLFGVIRNTASDWRRRAWRRWRRLVPASDVEEPVEPGSEATARDEALRSETRGQLERALVALPPRQREVLHLVFYQELSVSEAAAAMGVGVGSARRHYERGKARLREKLKNLRPGHE